MLGLLGKRRPRQSDRFCLNDAGREKMQADWGDGGLASRVMVALESSDGSMSISELAATTHTAPDRLARLIAQMKHKGWITKSEVTDG